MAFEGSLRKCLVKKWADTVGYGFNLHAEMGKAGHYIGKVDGGSPAEAAGLLDGDRIVEVNDVNIGNENHKQVVTRIKAGGDSVWLLVIDKVGDEYCKNNKILINHNHAQMKTIECPDECPTTAVKDDDSNKDSATENSQKAEHEYEIPVEPPKPSAEKSGSEHSDDDEDLPPPPELTELDDALNYSNDEPPKPAEPETNGTNEQEPEEHPEVSAPEAEPAPEVEDEEPPNPPEPEKSVEPAEPAEPAKPETPEPKEPEPQNGSSSQPEPPASGPIPKMSAAEMREALAKKKKKDPRKEQHLTAKDKLKMFQNL